MRAGYFLLGTANEEYVGITEHCRIGQEILHLCYITYELDLMCDCAKVSGSVGFEVG